MAEKIKQCREGPARIVIATPFGVAPIHKRSETRAKEGETIKRLVCAIRSGGRGVRGETHSGIVVKRI